MQHTVKDDFLTKLLNKQVTIFQNNGFQVRGILTAFDHTGLKVKTTQYNNSNNALPREIFISDHSYAAVVPNC